MSEMDEILNVLRIAVKARKVVLGEELVLSGIRNKSICLVLLANDAGPNTTKRITDKSTFYGIKLLTTLSSIDFDQCLTKKGRKVIGITDKGFANSILSK